MSNRPFLSPVIALAAALLLALLGSSVSDVPATLITIGIFIFFALPGVLLYSGRGWTRRAPLTVVLGSCTGFAVVGLTNAFIVRWLGWDISLWMTPFLAFTAGLGFLVIRTRIAGTVPLAEQYTFSRQDWWFLATIIVTVLGMNLVALARVGEVVDGFHEFHGLFAHDLLWRAVLSQGVANGLPAMDMFMASERIDNYLFYYSIIAFAIRFSDGTALPFEFVAASDLVLPILFIVALVLVFRAFGASGRTAWIGVVFGMFCYSYNGIYVLAKYTIISRNPWLNSIAGGYSDTSFGWYRDFLVEPHATLALLFAASAIIIHRSIEQSGYSILRQGLLGLFLLLSFASDSFVGVLMCAWYAMVVFVRFFRGPRLMRPRHAQGLAITGTTFLIFLVLSLATGLFSFGASSGALVLRPFPPALKFGIALYPLVLGPGLLFAAWFIYRHLRSAEVRKSHSGLESMYVLLLVTFATSLLVMHNLPENDAVVFRKSIKLLQVPIYLFAAFGIQDAWRNISSSFANGQRYWRLSLLIVAPVALSLSTLWSDVGSWTGFLNSSQSSRISIAEFEANQWIRRETSPGTVIQSLPEHPAPVYSLSPVAMLAGRPMALGNLKQARLSTPSPEYLESLLHDIRTLFQSDNAALAERICLKRNIEFVYIGPHEKQFAPHGISKFQSNDAPFVRLFSNGDVDIYRLLPSKSLLR